MESCTATHKSRDILSRFWLSFAVFYLPGIAIVVAASTGFPSAWRTGVWAVSLSIMGAGCVANALLCGRVHCYITGPFFLLMALVTLSNGLGVLPLGRNGWNLIGGTILIGAIALWCLPEMLLGKYRTGAKSATSADSPSGSPR
jgi:hypothetical protein